MMNKLDKTFYNQPALKIAKEFLGKYLVYCSPKGKLSGKIVDVEAYPAFIDEVSHGNKRTKRTQVIYEEGGRAYVYLIYGMHHQFAVVVNKKDMTVTKRNITLQEGIGETVVVTGGLNPGETIVGAGAVYLSEGMKVRPWSK